MMPPAFHDSENTSAPLPEAHLSSVKIFGAAGAVQRVPGVRGPGWRRPSPRRSPARRGCSSWAASLFRQHGEWRTRADPDTLRVGLVHLATFVLPATLWAGAVISRWCACRPIKVPASLWSQLFR